MTKLEFLQALGKRLSSLAPADAEERLRFYVEMIEDRMEEGLGEEEAVAAVGSAEEISAQILAEFPQAESKKRTTTGWEIALLILGSPVWFSLYVSVWAVIISLWAVFGSLVACAVVVPLGGIVLAATGNRLAGIVLLSGALVCAGLAIFLFLGCKVLTDGTARLTKKLAVRCFHKKEAVL